MLCKRLNQCVLASSQIQFIQLFHIQFTISNRDPEKLYLEGIYQNA